VQLRGSDKIQHNKRTHMIKIYMIKLNNINYNNNNHHHHHQHQQQQQQQGIT